MISNCIVENLPCLIFLPFLIIYNIFSKFDNKKSFELILITDKSENNPLDENEEDNTEIKRNNFVMIFHYFMSFDLFLEAIVLFFIEQFKTTYINYVDRTISSLILSISAIIWLAWTMILFKNKENYKNMVIFVKLFWLLNIVASLLGLIYFFDKENILDPIFRITRTIPLSILFIAVFFHDLSFFNKFINIEKPKKKMSNEQHSKMKNLSKSTPFIPLINLIPATNFQINFEQTSNDPEKIYYFTTKYEDHSYPNQKTYKEFQQLALNLEILTHFKYFSPMEKSTALDTCNDLNSFFSDLAINYDPKLFPILKNFLNITISGPSPTPRRRQIAKTPRKYTGSPLRKKETISPINTDTLFIDIDPFSSKIMDSDTNSGYIKGFLLEIDNISIFKKDTIVEYKIDLFNRSKNQKWTIYKTYQDFKEFNKKLGDFYRRKIREFEILVPKAKSYKFAMRDEFLEKRIRGIENYFQKILKSVALQCDIFFNFIEYDMEKEMPKDYISPYLNLNISYSPNNSKQNEVFCVNLVKEEKKSNRTRPFQLKKILSLNLHLKKVVKGIDFNCVTIHLEMIRGVREIDNPLNVFYYFMLDEYSTITLEIKTRIKLAHSYSEIKRFHELFCRLSEDFDNFSIETHLPENIKFDSEIEDPIFISKIKEKWEFYFENVMKITRIEENASFMTFFFLDRLENNFEYLRGDCVQIDFSGWI